MYTPYRLCIYYTELIKLLCLVLSYVQQGKTMVTMAGDSKFYIYVKILTSLAMWGPRGGGGGGA